MRTLGVEEEFLLVRPSRRDLASQGEAVVELAARTDEGGQFEVELKQEQAELGTAPASTLADLAQNLRNLRRGLTDASSRRGVRLMAIGTSPFGTSSNTTRNDRYERMERQFGIIAREQLTCGMHVHVSVESPDEGVAVLDRIRPWLAPFVALSSNSPFWDGHDTGYASYRTVLWGQWPTAGPVEAFGDLATYEKVRRDLIASGAALDDGMLYYDARLSANYPTVEIRVADICARSEDAIAIAGLMRALVETAADAKDDSLSYVRRELLRAATWRAGRFGTAGGLVDVLGVVAGQGAAGSTVPAWDLIEALVEWVRPALEKYGDYEHIIRGLADIRVNGTGADLQRRTFAEDGSMVSVLHAVSAVMNRA